MARFLAGLLCLLGVAAQADPVIVSVGKAEDVTRLVFTFSNRPAWSATTLGQDVRISLPTTGFEFDLPEDTPQFPGSRIATVTVTDVGLVVAMNCDCRAKVYDFGQGGLVVDVENSEFVDAGPAILSSPQQPVVVPPNLDMPDLGDGFPDAPMTGRVAPDLMQHTGHAPLSEFKAPLPLVTGGLSNGLIESLDFPGSGEDQTSSAVELLSRGLSRAASQGMIEASEGSRPRRATARADVGLSDRSNLSVVTGLDQGFQVGRDTISPTHDGSICFPDSAVDVLQWGDTSDLRHLGRLRGDAISEDGHVRPEGAEAIARYYIALGFGSEAAVAARAIETGRRRDLLLTLAEIIDHGRATTETLNGQIFCEGKVALWAALARPIDPSDVPTSTNEILATFSALPPHLRAHLGPVLAERLRAVGLEDDARRAVNAVARGGLQSNESELVASRLGLAGTRHDEARDTLSNLSNGTDVTAAEALLELLEDAERRQLPPNPAWVKDAPSLTRVTEGTEIAAKLNLAGLRGRIALGQFDELRDALSMESPGLDPQSRNDLSVMALAAAADVADDVTFLKSELGFSRLIEVETMPRAARFAIAERLSNLGLPMRARMYLPDTPDTASERRAAADILFETGQLDDAVALLSGRIEEDVVTQLGAIYAKEGQEDLAIRAFEAGGRPTQAAFAAMRAGDWQWIADRELDGSTGQLSEATRRLLSPLSDTLEATGPGNGALVIGSQERRAQIRALLSETEITDDLTPFTN